MENRIKVLNNKAHKNNVLYLMNRDQRIHHNYSVELGYDLSYKTKTRFIIGIDFPNIKMNEKQERFVFEGFCELKNDCKSLSIPCYLINNLESFLKDFSIDCVVLDFCPLRDIKERDKKILKICKNKKILLQICDSHNIVPCWMLEVYKRTLKAVRTDLYKLYDQFIVPFKDTSVHVYNKEYLKKHPTDKSKLNKVPVGEITKMAYVDLLDLKITSSKEKNAYKGGHKQGIKAMKDFFDNRFEIYSKERNNTEADANIDLIPWIHTGQISAQYIVLEANKRFATSENLYSFLEEIFVWKETADHFVYHEDNYDNINGSLGWAQETLENHKTDPRKIVYETKVLKNGKTKDKLWNAAQKELLTTGIMHRYAKMYWCKKLLEWKKTPEEALKVAIGFNDENSYDGHDCNGYLDIMWSICGVMDRAFVDRPICGKVRFMKSHKSPNYIDKWSTAKQ